MLAAKGIQLEPQKSLDGRGRESTYTITVHKNGQIMIGAAYTQEMGFETRDEFKIKLGYKQIHLIKLGEDGNEDAD